MIRRIALPLTALLALVAAPLAAQTFPELTGRVVDQADILPAPVEEDLSAKLEALETATQRQLVVATITSLEGYDIADYGYRLGREWELGDAQRNDGAMLLVAPNERQVRIEVGYGLEGYITDAYSAYIIQSEIVPLFKQEDMVGGIEAGTNALVTHLGLPEDEAFAARNLVEEQARIADRVDFGDAAGVILANLFILFVMFLIISQIGKGARNGSSGGGSWSGSRGGSTSSSRSSSSSFSGGGGSFGGGGASGSW